MQSGIGQNISERIHHEHLLEWMKLPIFASATFKLYRICGLHVTNTHFMVLSTAGAKRICWHHQHGGTHGSLLKQLPEHCLLDGAGEREARPTGSTICMVH